MVRGIPYESSFQSFSCSDKAWETLLNIGKEHGWVPKGTIPGEKAYGWIDNRPQDFRAKEHINDYVPIDWYFHKKVLKDDAESWCLALRKAIEEPEMHNVKINQPIYLSEDMNESTFNRINAGVMEIAKQFIAFAESGEFKFAYDD
jgi:hypothetical protein